MTGVVVSCMQLISFHEVFVKNDLEERQWARKVLKDVIS